MATKVGGVFYEVTLDTSKMINGQREAARRLDAVADNGDRLQARMTKVAAGITAALASIAVAGLVSKLIDTQRQFDVMFASLKTMTGGVDQAGAAFERLRKFAAQTPYTLEQSVNGFVKLKALGLDPTERAMTSFGNTAAAMGKDLTQMIEAVADASTGEFERLKEFGIKARVEGDKVALTFQGTTTLVRNSAAEITEYLTKIGEVEFAGAMSERMKTLDGDISNLQDSLSALYLSVSQSGFGDAIAKGVRAATEAINEATTSIKEGGLTEYFDDLRPIIAAAELAVVSLAGAITGRLVAAFIAQITQAYAAAAAVGAATAAARGFTAVLAALGGPIGLAITALGILALNWDKVAGSARDAATMSEDAAERIAGALRKAPARATADLQAQLKAVKDEISDIDAERSRTSFPKASDADLKELATRRDTLVKIAADITTAMDKVYGQGRRPANEGGGGLASRNRPAGGGTKPAKAAGDAFDSEGYLAGLERSTLDGIALIDAAENESLRKNAELLRTKKINADDASRAITLIERNAAQDRAAIREKELQDTIEDARDAAQKEEDLAKQRAEARARGLRMAQDAAVINDPVAQLELRLARESELLKQYALDDMANEQIYAQAKVALEQETADQITAIRERAIQEQVNNSLQMINVASSVAGQLLAIEQAAGKERSTLSKALFLTQKALAVAEIIINTEVAASKAYAQFGAYGAAAAIAIRGAGYASAGLVAGQAVAEVSGGRQYGGPVSAGSMYRVNEGGRPEMYTASNGNQYMLPTADGRVTSAGDVGQGGGKTTVLNVSQSFHIPAGTSLQTQQQTAAAAMRGLQAAAARNN
jgi:hypothetical protein